MSCNSSLSMLVVMSCTYLAHIWAEAPPFLWRLWWVVTGVCHAPELAVCFVGPDPCSGWWRPGIEGTWSAARLELCQHFLWWRKQQLVINENHRRKYMQVKERAGKINHQCKLALTNVCRPLPTQRERLRQWTLTVLTVLVTDVRYCLALVSSQASDNSVWLFNSCIVPFRFLPWEIWVAFPSESQQSQCCTIQPMVHARCFLFP